MYTPVPLLYFQYPFTQVRWADLEAKKEEELQKEMGFHIGGKWAKISEEEAAGLLHGDDTT